jgi:hypothetical protein
VEAVQEEAEDDVELEAASWIKDPLDIWCQNPGSVDASIFW